MSTQYSCFWIKCQCLPHNKINDNICSCNYTEISNRFKENVLAPPIILGQDPLRLVVSKGYLREETLNSDTYRWASILPLKILHYCCGSTLFPRGRGESPSTRIVIMRTRTWFYKGSYWVSLDMQTEKSVQHVPRLPLSDWRKGTQWNQILSSALVASRKSKCNLFCSQALMNLLNHKCKGCWAKSMCWPSYYLTLGFPGKPWSPGALSSQLC